MVKKSIPTPCIEICKIDNSSGLCQGCYRTRAEIARWGMMQNDERFKIMRELDQRKQFIRPIDMRCNR